MGKITIKGDKNEKYKNATRVYSIERLKALLKGREFVRAEILAEDGHGEYIEMADGEMIRVSGYGDFNGAVFRLLSAKG